MVRIRLRRVGSRHQPSFRIIAADRSSPRDGRFLEVLGHYNPRTEPATVRVDEAKLFHWLKNGAQPSESVVRILRPLGTWDRWERYKQGEDLEKLLAEAEAAYPEVDPRTRRDDLMEARAAKKASGKAAAEASEDKAEAEAPKDKVKEATESEPAEEEPTAQAEAAEDPEAPAVDEAADKESAEPAEAEAAAEPPETEGGAEGAQSEDKES